MTNPESMQLMSKEAEEAVIGSLFIDEKRWHEISPFLQSNDFFFVRNQEIYKAIEKSVEDHDTFDIITVTDILRSRGKLDEVGGEAYILSCVNTTGTSVYTSIYARIIERIAVRRRLLEIVPKIRELAFDEEISLDEVLGKAETLIRNVHSASLVQNEWTDMKDAVSKWFDELEHRIVERNKGNDPGIPTFFRDLDAIIHMNPGDVVAIAGRPGMGKTALSVCMAMNMARRNIPVGFVSLEMDELEIIQRMVSAETGITGQSLSKAEIESKTEMSRIIECIGRISNWPFWIDDSPGQTIQQVRNKCRRLKYEAGVKVIFIDYGQLLSSEGNRSGDQLEMQSISKNLKEMAKELEVVVIPLLQLNREVETRQDKRPTLSALRSSGAWEQDADVVFAVYRPEYYEDDTEFPGHTECIILKQRNGATGTILLHFEAELAKFTDASIHGVDLSDLE